MNARPAALAVVLVSILSTAAGCARADSTAGAQSPAPVTHPVVAFGVAAAPQPKPAPHKARFEVDVDKVTHIDFAGSPRR
jgi:hypothetical protein